MLHNPITPSLSTPTPHTTRTTHTKHTKHTQPGRFVEFKQKDLGPGFDMKELGGSECLVFDFSGV